MKNFVFRNYTIEYLFDNTTKCGGYGDISIPNEEMDNYILFYQLDPSKTPELQIEEIEEIKSKISLLTNLISNKRIIIVNLYVDYRRNWVIKNTELSSAISHYNEVFLKELQSSNSSVKVIDINAFYQSQVIDAIDWRFYFTSQMIINPKLAKSFKKWFNSQLDYLSLKRKKCIVLDCDNTLWGGVVGEDGVFGVKLGQDYPGNAFRSFQEHLLALSQKGVILAVCSKNNLEDVQELWKNNSHHLINDSVLSAYRINWQNKAENIKSIAEELNIGVDSFVFIDDNPLERGIVKEFLPEVAVPDFPEKPYELLDFFWQVYHEHFGAYELSGEDLKKTDQYKENFFRNESKKVFDNMDDYLASLEIEIDIIAVDDSNITRIAQMTQKTNQFNLRTIRYTEEEIRLKIAKGSLVYCANVKDKYGDNGITIACIIDEFDNELFLDTYLLSCRILGREIEKVTLLRIIKDAINLKGKSLRGSFIPSKKNAMAKEFLDKVGFTLKDELEDGERVYSFDEEKDIEIKDYYKINKK